MIFDRRFSISGMTSRAQVNNYLRPVLCVLFLASFMVSVIAPECLGQSFGKNKVTARHFDWLTYKTSHFTIYYYPDEELLVRTMADTAEIAYARISSILEHSIEKNTPLILYKSHGDFRQTNVTLEALSEGIGGFAELLKYRVVIPFTGSMSEFQKVLTHEITHIFEYDVLYKDIFSHIYTGEFLRSPPIWFLEGLAEYMADHWDAQGEMVLRDAVMDDSIVSLVYLQDFSPLGSRVYLGYKEGQSAVQYLAEQYGDEKLAEILRELGDSRSKDIDSAMRNSIGISLKDFDKKWRQALKEQYWPMIADRQSPGTTKKNLTKKDERHPYNVRAKWSPSGDLIAYITYQDGYEEIRIVSAKNGKLFSRPTKALRGERYDSIREKGNGLAWSPDGDKIAFIGMKKDQDYLLTVNIVTGELSDWIEMPFDAAHSPSWSPDGKYVAIVGYKDGRSDLYAFRLEDALMARLTSDAYDEGSLSWHPSKRKIVYSSERNGRYKLFVLDLPTQRSQQLTRGDQNDVSPTWTPDGKRVVFCADVNGIYDVFTIRSDGDDLTRLTNILTGCFTPVFSPDESSIALTIYHEGRNDIYVLSSEDFLNEKTSFPPEEEVKEPLYVLDDRGVKGVGYSLNFVPDMIYVDFGYLSGSGVQNTVQITVSDIMGDHRFMAGVDVASYRNGLDFQLAYYFLRKRLDVGGAVFNWNDFHVQGDDEFWQRSTGIAGYLSYPMDQFNRIDLQLGRYWRFLNFIGGEDERESLSLLSLSLVKDVVMWSSFGPYSGMRYNISLEQTARLTKRDLLMTNIMLDFRKYLKLGQRSNLSVRLLGAGSMGPDSDREMFFLGGTFRQSQAGFYFPKSLMRGYDFEEIAGNRVGLLNLEIRIPFVDELRFGWPFSWGLGGIRGVVFMDFAGVWPRPVGALDINDEHIISEISDREFEPWFRDEEGEFRLLDLRAAIGAGFRIGPFSFDFAKKTDLRDLGDGYKFHFALGQEF